MQPFNLPAKLEHIERKLDCIQSDVKLIQRDVGLIQADVGLVKRDIKTMRDYFDQHLSMCVHRDAPFTYMSRRACATNEDA